MSKSDTTASLPVMEHFYTIQGEGFHQGKPAYFIRLGGCDVGCVWCDVKDSWDAGKHPLIETNLLLSMLEKECHSKMVVITGGEPLMHNLDHLTAKLKSAGFTLHIETSGAHQPTGQWDWVCLSPKKFKPPVEEILHLANELKIIIFNKSDFDWAEQFASKMNDKCLLYLQPEWDKQESLMPDIIEYVKKNPKWRISLQIHKYINVP